MSERIEGKQEIQIWQSRNIWRKLLEQSGGFTPLDFWGQYVKLADAERKEVLVLARSILETESINRNEMRVSDGLLAMKKGPFWTEDELLEIKSKADKGVYRMESIPTADLNSSIMDHVSLYLSDLSSYLKNTHISLAHLCLPYNLMRYLKRNGYETIQLVHSALLSGELFNLRDFGDKEEMLLTKRFEGFRNNLESSGGKL